MLIVEAMCLNANRLMRGVCVDASGDMKGVRESSGGAGLLEKAKGRNDPRL